jgi:hypothetical protein
MIYCFKIFIMKTKFILPLIISMFVSQILYAQSLLIKGYFKNSENESIEVDYLLVSNNQVVSRGTNKKIKIELELNSDYILVVSKKGFISKSVSFATYTDDKDEYSFIFDMFLMEENDQKNIVTTVCTKVFYDTKLRSFNYLINKKQHSQY